MKEKRKNYAKPQSYVIESEQPLMSNASSIGISGEIQNEPGRMGVRRYEAYEEEEEEENGWN